MPKTVIALLAVLAAWGISLWWYGRKTRRQRAIARVLDAADALEARLRGARAEIQAIAGNEEDPMREPMQDMLRQRLWLQEHGHAASLDQLEAVRAALDAARTRIEQQLGRIERARDLQG